MTPGRRLGLLFLLGFVACARDALVLRPGAGFRVVDDATGLPLAGVRVAIFALHAGRDTVVSWQLVTDEAGTVVFPSVRTSLGQERRAGRGRAGYECVVCFTADGFRQYSQRVGPGIETVRLSRTFLIAVGRPGAADSASATWHLQPDMRRTALPGSCCPAG